MSLLIFFTLVIAAGIILDISSSAYYSIALILYPFIWLLGKLWSQRPRGKADEKH